MLTTIKKCVHKLGRWYIQRLNRSEWESQFSEHLNERPVEYAFAFTCLAELAPRTVLDVGTGKTALPSLLTSCAYHVTAIDNVFDYWPRGMFNRHFHVLSDDITKPALAARFDAVVCISTLEHIVRYELALKSMLSLVNRGGHVILTCPYNEHVASADCYKERGTWDKGSPFICRQFTRADFDPCLQAAGASIVKQELWQFFDSPYWSCGRQIQPPKRVSAESAHQLTCMLLRVPA